MTNREFFIARVKPDAPAFGKVIRAIPAAGANYRPHPKSRSAAELAWLLAGSMTRASELIESRRVEWTDPTVGPSLAAAADTVDTAVKDLLARVGKLDGKAWARKATLTMGGDVAWTAPLGDMLWGFFLDAIHHRGQLSTYIRPAGGKVPSIYGPSGDETGG